MEFCEKHGITPKEHALAYEYMFPDWAKKLPIVELKKRLTKRFKEISERYADKIYTIEVTNEMYRSAAEMPSSFYFDDEYAEWCFKEAEKYFPNNQLVINELTGTSWDGGYHNRTAYYMYVERALRNGARIDAIGFQFHMMYPPEEELEAAKVFYDPLLLYRVMDRFSDFNKPLQITEITIASQGDDEENEAIQAQIIKYLYKIWFGHKNVEQIIYWNLVDGYAAFADPGDMTGGENACRGGLLRYDLSPKPSYYVIKDLFEKEWHTKIDIETDNEGHAFFKGFYGDYSVVINGNEYMVSAIKSAHRYPDGTIKIDITI